jgi:hypothetical protein
MKWIKFDKDDESTWPTNNKRVVVWNIGCNHWDTMYFWKSRDDPDEPDAYWFNQGKYPLSTVSHYAIPEPPK